ncbi:MAG TPA: small acid-soluble spore protein P [Bacilli bacterium]
MPKDIPQPVNPPTGKTHKNEENIKQPNKPLSGSKDVKNRNHSRQNHGEGS